MRDKPSKWQVKRFYLAFLAGILIFGCYEACEATEAYPILMDHGAGDTWTCGNCGLSNYCWQMSCSNCGESQ